MKFSTAFSIALLSLAKLIIADSETFGFLAIRSGSVLQYASAYSQDGKLYLGSSSAGSVTGIVTDAGKVKLSDNTYIVVDTDGSLTEGSEDAATTGFTIQDGRLAYHGSEGFYGVPSGSSYIFSTVSSDGALGVAIRATSTTSGQPIPDFPTSDNSTSTTTIAPTTSSTSTWVPSYNTTSTGNNTTYTNTQTATETETKTCTECSTVLPTFTNGVNKVAAGVGAGAFAAAAALLL